ncbi:phosphoheptose isomerase [Clostridia bacterium]|nr:phosphoheptose isomerase [Clostridia bacterium]
MKLTSKKLVDELVSRYPELDCCHKSVLNSVQTIIDSYQSEGKLLVCGNGGSAADALHIVGELMKSFVLPRLLDDDLQRDIHTTYPETAEYLTDNLQGALPAIALVNEVSLITAYSNDAAPDLSFAQQVVGFGKKGDVLVAISTSGNSKNVLYATQMAKVLGMQVIGLTGQDGGKLKDLCDEAILVPSNETYKIQEYHLPIYHAICLAVENEFFGGK